MGTGAAESQAAAAEATQRPPQDSLLEPSHQGWGSSLSSAPRLHREPPRHRRSASRPGPELRSDFLQPPPAKRAGVPLRCGRPPRVYGDDSHTHTHTHIGEACRGHTPWGSLQEARPPSTALASGSCPTPPSHAPERSQHVFKALCPSKQPRDSLCRTATSPGRGSASPQRRSPPVCPGKHGSGGPTPLKHTAWPHGYPALLTGRGHGRREAPPRGGGGGSHTRRSLPSPGSGPDALQDPRPPAHVPLKKLSLRKKSHLESHLSGWDTVIRSPSWSGKNKTATCENGIENEPSKVSTRTASGKWNPGPDGGSPDGPPVHFGTVKATLILLQHRNHRRH